MQGYPPGGAPRPDQQPAPSQGAPYGAPVPPQPPVNPYAAPAAPMPPQPNPFAPAAQPPQGAGYGLPPSIPQTQPPAQPEPEQAPPPVFTPPRRRPHIVPFVILFGVLVLAGLYLYWVFRPDPPGLATIQSQGIRAAYGGDAVILRDETVFINANKTGIDYVANEGTMVSRGDSICNIYTSTSSARDLKSLRTYRSQIRNYLITLTPSLSDLQLDAYNRDVLTRALECRAMAQSGIGDATARQAALTSAIDTRQSYLRVKYPDDQKLTRLFDDENARRQSIETYTKQYSATFTGLVSFYCDGYESAVNLTGMESITPGTARRVAQGARVDGYATDGFVYRMVTQGTWGVLLLCDDTTWMPAEGATYNLVIEDMQNTVVPARLISFTLSGGELLLRLQVTGDVRAMLYTRACRASIGETVQSFRVPVRALIQDKALGTCVWCVIGDTQGAVPVRVISRDAQYVYLLPGAGYEAYIVDGQTVRTF